MQAAPDGSEVMTAPARALAVWPGFILLQILLHLLMPVYVAALLLRSRREPGYRRGFAQRFGGGPLADRGAVWVFAASLGETRAVSPLVRALRAAGHPVCLSASSPAGVSEARRLFGPDRGVVARFAPFDLFWTVGLFLVRQRPSALLIVESEVWPAKLLLSGLAGIPRIQVNGNLVERTLGRRILGLPSPVVPFYRAFDAILTKSEAHRARYLRAGVAPGRIALVGELKFDQTRPPSQVAAGRALAASWAAECPVVLIASSIAAEEADFLRIVDRLTARPDPPRLIWAPRSPQRFDAVAGALSDHGHMVIRRSATPDLKRVTGDTVLLADSLGEMNAWYAAAEVVVVGATLADHGGHNIVEPLALGCPVLTGPSIWGIAFPAHEAAAAGCLAVARDAQDLAARLEALLDDPDARRAMSDSARNFASAHVGATSRSLTIIERLLARR